MKRHLVIFARAPQFGRVKRRLAEAIGPVAAMRFYRQTLDRQIRTLSRDRRWTVWLFVTPDHVSTTRPGTERTCAARDKAISANA